jgi:hypothetical protein
VTLSFKNGWNKEYEWNGRGGDPFGQAAPNWLRTFRLTLDFCFRSQLPVRYQGLCQLPSSTLFSLRLTQSSLLLVPPPLCCAQCSMTFPPLLVVLCGLPGSGKSTLCQLLCSNLPQQLSSRLHISEANISVHHICLDDVLATELQRAGTPSNSFDVKIWHKSREIAHQEVQKLITNYLVRGLLTNYSRRL